MLSFKKKLERNIENAEKEIKNLKRDPLYNITTVEQLLRKTEKEIIDKVKESILEFSEGGIKTIEIKVEKLNTSSSPIKLSIADSDEQKNLMLLVKSGNKKGLNSHIIDWVSVPDIIETYVDLNPDKENEIRDMIVCSIVGTLKIEGLSVDINASAGTIKVLI